MLTYKRLMKSYNELRKNLTKISRGFENRAPGSSDEGRTAQSGCRLSDKVNRLGV